MADLADRLGLLADRLGDDAKLKQDTIVLGVIAALRDEADRARAWPEPWPRTQPMPFAVAGGVAQPWRHRAVTEYDKARGTVTEQRHGSHGLYTAAQVNRAIGWWNERAARLGRSAGGS